MAPRTTPSPPRGTWGATRGTAATTSHSRATTIATPAAARQATSAWVPGDLRPSTTSVAKDTTPSVTTRVDPSDSVTRIRPAGRVSWPITPTMKPAAVTYASGASDAGRAHTAPTSVPMATATPTPA